MEEVAEVTAVQAKVRFSKSELGFAFGMSLPTVVKHIGDIAPIGKRGNSIVWRLSDVADLKDVRDHIKKSYVNQYNMHESDDPDDIELDPDKMKPADRRVHYQAEDLKQAALLKSRKNAIESRELIPAHEVETALAQAFKTIALTLDTLPDSLERDGLISSGDIEKVITLLDRSREQLSGDLSALSPEVQLTNMIGDW